MGGGNKRKAKGAAEDPDGSVWDNIRGPASALIATMESIGWRMSAPYACTTDTGITLNLKKQRPALILDYVEKAVERKVWHHSKMSEEDRIGKDWDYEGDVPWWYPLREMANSKDTAMARAARSVIIGTQWPQARIAKTKEKEKVEPWCKACLPLHEIPGTCQQRHCKCPAYAKNRNDNLGIPARGRLKNNVGGDIFKKNCTLMRRELPKWNRQTKWEPVWGNEAAPKKFRGTIYVDGSGDICRWEPSLSTVGWAAVGMSDEYNKTESRWHGKKHEADEREEIHEESEEEEETCGCKNSGSTAHSAMDGAKNTWGAMASVKGQRKASRKTRCATQEFARRLAHL